MTPPAMLRPPAALDPAGPFAAPLAELSWILIVGGFAVLLLVLAALAAALFGPPRARAFVASRRLVVWAGLVFPLVTVTLLLAFSLLLTPRIMSAPQPGDLRIRVVGEMWWWRVLYLDADSGVAFETANEIVIPANRPVALELQSADVIHSFWVPQLGGKVDMMPGRTNTLRIQADAPGLYRGQCAEYCGASHALMALDVAAMRDDEFAAWTALQAAPAAAEGGSGAAGFETFGCGACHRVRGTEANGLLGPDLTHVASRRMLAGGILPNTRETLAAFLEDPAALKPGVRMPSYARLSDAEAAALLDYLETLR